MSSFKVYDSFQDFPADFDETFVRYRYEHGEFFKNKKKTILICQFLYDSPAAESDTLNWIHIEIKLLYTGTIGLECVSV
jgi:hypothetical protein